VLLTAGVASSAAFVAVALFAVSAPVVAAIGAALAGFFAPPLEPSLRSLWPRIVPPGKPLKAAFSLDAGAQEILFILGPILTVAGIAAFGATGNIVFAASLGLIGTLAFAANPVSREVTFVDPTDAARQSPLRNPRLLRVVGFTFGVGVPVGVLTIAATGYEESHAIAGFAGWALAANAIGALVGATVLALRPLTVAPSRAIALCGVALAILYLPLALDLPWPLWLVAAGLSGVMLPPTLAQVFESVALLSASVGLNEANAWAVSAINVGIATGTLGAGAIASAGGGLGVPVILATAITLMLSILVVPRSFR
jgi:hypothetical protein